MAALKYWDTDAGEWKPLFATSDVDKAYVDSVAAAKIDKAGDTMTGPLAVVTSESDGITVDPVDPDSSIEGGVRVTGKEARFVMDRPSDPNNSSTVEFQVDGTRRAAINVNNGGMGLYCNGNAGELGGGIGAMPTAVGAANISTNVGGAYLRAKDVLLQGESVRLKALSNAAWSPVNDDDVVNKGYVDHTLNDGLHMQRGVATSGTGGDVTIGLSVFSSAPSVTSIAVGDAGKNVVITSGPTTTSVRLRAVNSNTFVGASGVTLSWIAVGPRA